jgi:hypothetical protein
MFADPKAAWEAFCEFKPIMNTPLNEKIYERYVQCLTFQVQKQID